ncbi:hypothetical protein VTO73DRAFT_6532 [Trametes versicolor]
MSTSESPKLMTPSLDDDTSTVYEDMEHEDSSPDVLEKQNATSQPLRAVTTDGTADTAIKHAPPPVQGPGPVTLSPHIIVVGGTITHSRTAWGRAGVAKLGYHQFARMVFDTFILHPSRAPKWAFSPFVKSQRAIFYEAYNFLQADFAARVKFRPQWAGQGDGSEGSVEESVMLQPVGWQEMMQKIVKIQVEYQPPEVYPNKVELLKILGKTPKAE